MPSRIRAVAEAAAKRHHVDAHSDAASYAAGILTWVIAGSVFVVVKIGMSQIPPWTLCFLRALISALILIPLASGHYRDMIALLRHRGWEAAFIGAVGLGLTQGVLFTELTLTSAINVGIVFALVPMATILLARPTLGKPMNGWQVLGSVVAFVGVVVICVHGSLVVLRGLDIGVGDLVALCATLLFAGYTVLLKRAKFDLLDHLIVDEDWTPQRLRQLGVNYLFAVATNNSESLSRRQQSVAGLFNSAADRWDL
jgi:drug/metabolite transporter (DMT)-like permease